MTTSVIKIEIRYFISQEHRDAFWEADGDDVITNPSDYGVKKLDYAQAEAPLRWKVRGVDPNTVSFAKILKRPGQQEHYACHTQDIEMAIGWIYNP
jgi:hypothetical protein